MARKQTTARQRQLLERTLSQLAIWIQDLAPQAQVDITLEQYEDEDAHLYVHPPPGDDCRRRRASGTDGGGVLQ
jgi:hypothetical protein